MSLNLHVIGDHSSIYSCSAGTNSSSKLVSKGVQSEEDEVKSNFKLAYSSFNAGATHTVPKLSPLFIPLPPLTTTEAAPRSGRSDLLSSCRKKNCPEQKARMNHSDLMSLAPKLMARIAPLEKGCISVFNTCPTNSDVPAVDASPAGAASSEAEPPVVAAASNAVVRTVTI